MKKFRLLLIIAVMLVCSLFTATLVGCKDDEGGTTDEVTITYYRYESSAPLTMTVNKGDPFTFATLPKRKHFVFMGMYDLPNGEGNEIIDERGVSTVVFDRDITLYMHWLPATYTFEFDAGEGTLSTTENVMNVTYNTNVTLMPEASLQGFDFKGWYCDGVQISNGAMVLSDKMVFNDTNYEISNDGKVSLVAEYEVKKYTITFDYNDGTYREDSVDVPYGSEVDTTTFPTVDDGKKELIGWSTSTSRFIEFEGKITGDVRLYAFWKRYKVLTFYDMVSEDPVEYRVYEDEPYVPEALDTKPGYQFMGWYNNELLTGTPIDKVYYTGAYTEFFARWDMVTYTLTLHTNGGTCSETTFEYTIEDSVELPKPEKNNYTFVNWYAEEDFSGIPYTSIEEGTYGVEDLYAKYIGESKKLVLNGGGGFVSPSFKFIRYGEDYTLPIPIYTEYIFLGWFDGQDEGANKITEADGESLAPLEFDADEIQLYAHYKQKLHITVNVSIEAAGSVEVEEYYLEGDDVTLTATLNEGYKFNGWSVDGDVKETELEYNFTMGDSHMTIDLLYEPIVYTVTLVAGDGVTCDETSVEVEYGSTFELPVASRDGYRFIGWKYNNKVITNGEGKGVSAWKYTTDITVYAYLYEEDPNSIFVYDGASFMAMKDNPSANYVLVADVDMSDFDGEWVPFEFKGTFLGNGLAIKNFTLTTSANNLGIFSKVSGTIKEVTFENVSIISTSYNSVYVGGVCAELTGTLENVKVSGEVKGDFCRIGGLVGYSTGTITNCSNFANVTTATYEENVSAGGIAGQFNGGSITNAENYGTISIKRYGGGIIGYATATGFSDLYNYGKVIGDYATGGIIGLFSKSGDMALMAKLVNEGEVEGGDRVGGIYGFISNTWSQGYNSAGHTFKLGNATNSGKVSGEGYVGGIIGYVTTYTSGSGSNGSVTLTITSFANGGDVTGTTHVGGLIGYAYSDTGTSSITNSQSAATITADSYVGGLAGRLENVSLITCSNVGTILIAEGYTLDGTTYYGYIGGYVGYGYYVEDCDNDVNVRYLEKGIYVGGIAGRLANTLKNVTNTGNVTAKNASYVGGLVGLLNYNGGYDVAVLTNSGDVEGKDYVGGIIGELSNGWDQAYNTTVHTLKVINLTNNGAVVGQNYVGGIMGNLSASTWGSGNNGSVIVNVNVLNNDGDVQGTTYVGGLFGRAYSDNGGSSITGSTSTADITADARVGGLAGRLENVKLIDSSNEGSTVTATGYILDGTTYYGYVGGYVGHGYYVEGCDNAVEINYAKNGIYVGGIAGRLDNAITKSTNTANVTATNSNYVGGLVGLVNCTGSYEFNTLNNSGDVTGKDYVGGVIGEVYNGWDNGYNGGSYSVKVINATNSGDVKGGIQVGGIIGNISASTWGSGNNGSVLISASALNNTGDITGVNYVGGLVGDAYSDTGSSSIEASTSSATITGEAYVGGLAGRLQNVMLIECYNVNSSIVATGVIIDGTNYYGYVGGYVGHGYYVEKCDNAVSIAYSKNGSYVGGIAGRLTHSIEECENVGDVTARNANYVGGLVGDVSSTGSYSFINLTNMGSVMGKDYVGGILGRVYNGWDNAYNGGSYTVAFTNVNNSGAVNGNDSVGGIAGDVYVNTWGSGNNGSILVTMNEIHCSANVSGSETVGGLFGSVSTDNGSSSINYYTFTGTVNGDSSDDATLIASTSNFTIGTEAE